MSRPSTRKNDPSKKSPKSDDASLVLEKDKLALEREKLDWEKEKFDKPKPFFLDRHFPAIISASIALFGIMFSGAQVWVAHIQKSREIVTAGIAKEAIKIEAEIENQRLWEFRITEFMALQGFSWQLSNGKRSNFAQKNMIRMR